MTKEPITSTIGEYCCICHKKFEPGEKIHQSMTGIVRTEYDEMIIEIEEKDYKEFHMSCLKEF